ncbi:MAG: 50S ribosomal protein L6 [Rhizobiaceae bacterium]
MSRIGKKPVTIPEGVTASLDGQTVTAKGPKGELQFVVNNIVLVKLEEGVVKVDPANDTKEARSYWGMTRTMIENIFTGVKDGYSKTLQINGVGYRAAMQGQNISLSLGFSHEVIYKPPQGVEIKCTKPTEIVITGHDKQVVGQVAAEIRSFRPPEPYKGKGVKYADEVIFRKEGKKK